MHLIFFLSLPIAAVEGCTALAFDSEATVDGSAFASMNADCSDCDTRLTFVPAATHAPGSRRPIYNNLLAYPRFIGSGRGDFYLPKEGEKITEPIGYMDQVEHTYGFWESTMPLMNTEGLGFGESSCAARLVDEPADNGGDAYMDVTELMRVSLERCVTARCAVDLMGSLVEQYGFFPQHGEASKGMEGSGRVSYDDAGEALTISDATGEAWVIHFVGSVKGVTKSVWAAQRVPKGHAAVVANNFILGYFPEKPNDDYRFNLKMFEAAKAAGFTDCKEWCSLHFTRTFGPDLRTFRAPENSVPIPMYTSLRLWGVLNKINPSLNLKLEMDSLDYPVFVKVDKKVNHRDVMNLLRETYAGTEFDMSLGVLAGPFGSPFRVEGGKMNGQIPRGVAILRTAYSVVTQSRPKFSTVWYAVDTPATSVYVPMYAASRGGIAEPYATGINRKFERQSAWWAYNFVNNWAHAVNYRGMYNGTVKPAIDKWDEQVDKEMQRIEKERLSPAELRTWEEDLQTNVVSFWWQMADFLIMKYNDGYTNYPRMGVSPGYPENFLKEIGFDNDIHPIWVKRAKAPPSGLLAENKNLLPSLWDFENQMWLYTSFEAPKYEHLITGGLMLAVGVVIGRKF